MVKGSLTKIPVANGCPAKVATPVNALPYGPLLEMEQAARQLDELKANSDPAAYLILKIAHISAISHQIKLKFCTITA